MNKLKKKIKGSIGEHLKPVKLHYNDIEEIYSVFQEAATQEINIENEEYELETVESIKSIDLPTINNLHFSTHNPYISLEFKKDSIWLYIDKDTPTQRGVYEKLKKIVKSKTQKKYFLFNTMVAFILFAIGSIFINIYKENFLTLAVGVSLLVLSLVVFLLSFRIRFLKYSIIYTCKKSNNCWFNWGCNWCFVDSIDTVVHLTSRSTRTAFFSAVFV
jgi:hypothetical protein